MDEVKFGSDCDLEAGYIPNSAGIDQGSATWPVFCVRNSKEKLQGRFGDPAWRYLQIRLHRCNATDVTNSHMGGALTAPLQKAWNDNGKGNGTCASQDAIDAMGSTGVNVWFRFPTEDWKKSGRLLSPKHGGMLNGWMW